MTRNAHSLNVLAAAEEFIFQILKCSLWLNHRGHSWVGKKNVFKLAPYLTQKSKRFSVNLSLWNPTCQSTDNPSHAESFSHKKAASHQFSKYKLWNHTVWALKSHVRAWLRSVSHNYCVALVASGAQLIFHRRAVAVSLLSAGSAGKSARGEGEWWCLHASVSHFNNHKEM